MRSEGWALGVSGEVEAELQRSLKQRALEVSLQVAVALFAMGVAAAVVLHPLPVVELRAMESVCAPPLSTYVGPASPLQVEGWVREFVELMLIQDSVHAERNLAEAFGRMGPRLRTRLQGSESLLEHFAEVKKRGLVGELEKLDVECGEHDALSVAKGPLHCVLWGSALYRPALSDIPKGHAPVAGHFFAKVTLEAGKATVENPLGLRALEFLPREAATAEDLRRILVEESGS